MQPNVTESLGLGVAVKVDGDIALDASLSFDDVMVSDHDTNVKSIEPHEAQWSETESRKEMLETESNPAKMELSHELTEPESSQVSPKCEKLEKAAASIDTEMIKSTLNSDEEISHELRQNENIPHEREMDTQPVASSLGDESSLGIEGHSPKNGEGSETAGSVLYSKQNDVLLREDSSISSVSFETNSSTNEYVQNYVGDDSSAVLENKFRIEVNDNSSSIQNVPSEVFEKPASRRNSGSENGLDMKDTEMVDKTLREEVVEKRPREELATTSESIESSRLPGSCFEESKVVKFCDNESSSTGTPELTDIGERKKGLTSCTEKDVTGKDATGKDATGKDATGKDATGKDATGKDATGKDATGKDATGKDVTGKDVTEKDATGNEATGKESAGTEDATEKEEGELEEGELDDDNDEERKDLLDNQACHTGTLGSASDEEDKYDGKKLNDTEEKKRKKKLDGEEEPKRKKKKKDHFYEDTSDEFRKQSDFDAMLEQYRRKAAGEEDDQSFKGPGYDDLERHRRRPDGRTPLLPHSKVEALCVPFLEGTCNKGNECQYSHNMNHSMIMQPHQRKMELCKFYQMGCCAKKQKCSYMHKDFPCKLYHTGMKCVPSDKCQYSHEPLSSITKSILLKHIEMAPKDILGTFPRLNNTAAQQIIAVTELCRNKRPCNIDSTPGIRDWRGKGFKYVDRAIRSFDRKSRRNQPESATEDELSVVQNADQSTPTKEGSQSPGRKDSGLQDPDHQDPTKLADHREHRPRSGAENEDGSMEEERKHGRSKKRHRSDRREDEDTVSQGRSESSRRHKHRSESRSSRQEDRRRQRMMEHYSNRDDPRLDEPCSRNAARFDYGGRDEPRMDDACSRSSSRRRASRWGDDREDTGLSSLSPGSSPSAHRHVAGRARADFLDNGEGYGKHAQGHERDRHSSRERRGRPSSDDDGRHNRHYGDPRESSEDDAPTAAIAAAVDGIPSMLDSFKRNSASHQDQDIRMSERIYSESDRSSERMYSESDRGSDRVLERNYTVDRSSNRIISPNSDRFNASDNNEESRSCHEFQGRYDPLEIFRRQQMQESASTRDMPVLGSSADGTVEYSPYLKNFKKVPSAAVSPVRPTSQHYPGQCGTSNSFFEGASRDREAADRRRDSVGSSSKEFRRTPPRSEDEDRSSSVVLKLNLNNINVPSDLAQVLSSLKSQTRLPKSDSVPASGATQSPTSKVSPRREDFMGLRDSPSAQDSPYLKSFRSWSPSTGSQISKDHSTLMSDLRQRASAENYHYENKRSDSMPPNFYEPFESRSDSEHAISDIRRDTKDQTLSNFRDPRLAREFSSMDQSSRSARSSSDSDDRSNDPALDVDLKRLQASSSSGSFMPEIPFEIPHHDPVTVINASITTSSPMMYRLVEVTVPKVNLDSIKSRFDKDHPLVHEDPRLFKMFFNPDASGLRNPGSIVYEDPQSPPPSEASPSQGSLESRDPRINRDPRVTETRNVDPRMNTDPRGNSDPRRNVDVRGNTDPRNRNALGVVGVIDPDVRLSGDESPDSRGDPRMGSHIDPRLESRRSDPRLNNRDPRTNRNFDEDNMMANKVIGEGYPSSLLGSVPSPMVPFMGPSMANVSGSSSMGLLNGPPGMSGHMPMPIAGPMPNMYQQNMMNQPPDMMHKMPHNMGPADMNPYSSRYGVGSHGPSMMGPGMGDPSVHPPLNSLGQGSHLAMNSNMLPPHSLQGNWPPNSNFQNADPRFKKN
ncbi:Zinc finger CCCH-type [Trinorchestia longiramus]|nr:Zinc finger CCCH-type [Trinorchestia longiramus]